MNRILTLGLILGASSALMAEPNISNADMKAKLPQIAGEKGMFAQNENFPKDYFLIGKNLPFSIGLTLHHPDSSTLELTKEQIDKLTTIKGKTMPVIIEAAKKIKALEIALSKKMMGGATAKDMELKVDEISLLKAELTKKHLVCIESVREVLTPEQRAILLGYVSKKRAVAK